MFQKFMFRHLKHRHFWRHKDFDELSELYISNLFRGLALSLTGLFIPIYMLRLHYSLVSVLSLVAWYFTFRCLIGDLLSGWTVAKIGPKHSLLVGYIILIASTTMFLSQPSQYWPIWLLGGIWGVSNSFFFIPFNVDFSKIKHSKHGGKELSFVYIMEKVGWAIGPLLGGLVGTLFGAQYIFLVAGVLLLIGAIPMFTTGEPVKLDQKLNFESLKADKLLYDALSFGAIGVENSITLYMWPLFLGLFVLTGSSVYAKLGILTSLSVVISVAASRYFGQIIDHKKGREILRSFAAVNAIIHLVRPLVTNFVGAFGINVANELATPGYRMPYFKALYDAADDLPGHRIVYLTSMEMIASTAKATMWWFLAALATLFSARTITTTGFAIGAIASLMIMSERFRSLASKAAKS
ncbi:MAG TPA: MFS transporter [Candidatus Saccharimonadales bacterium]|nr:MFS transporter [Candidatus Saccharimonadales bacterium]